MMRTAMGGWQYGSAELADLVTRGATVERSLPVSSLGRLAALGTPAGWISGRQEVPAARDVPDRAGEAAILTAEGIFQSGPDGYPQVRLRVTGTVSLICQRCLEPLAWPVHVDELLTLVRSDAEATGLADPFATALLTDAGVEMARVVEDEVMASLPLSPRHPATAACGRQELMNSGETHRPLAGLAGLLGRGDQQGKE